MIKPDNSGPAFPSPVPHDVGGSGAYVASGGMSLRQWYAGLAVQGLIARIADDYEGSTPDDPHLKAIAKHAVAYADALLKELEK